GAGPAGRPLLRQHGRAHPGPLPGRRRGSERVRARPRHRRVGVLDPQHDHLGRPGPALAERGHGQRGRLGRPGLALPAPDRPGGRSRDRLGSARIGMLAFSAGAGRPPLVNPAAFNYSAGSIWITTSRFAAKLQLARRDPRAAFLVDARGESLLLQGLLDVYDLRSLSGQLRAALSGPAFAWSLTGYALKNASFVGGYLL